MGRIKQREKGRNKSAGKTTLWSKYDKLNINDRSNCKGMEITVQDRISMDLKRGEMYDGKDKTKGQGKKNVSAKQHQGASITS